MLILDGIFYTPMSCKFDCIDIDFGDWFELPIEEKVFFSSRKQTDLCVVFEYVC